MPTLDAFFGEMGDSDLEDKSKKSDYVKGSKKNKIEDNVSQNNVYSGIEAKSNKEHLMTVDVDSLENTKIVGKLEEIKQKNDYFNKSNSSKCLPWTKKYAPKIEGDILGQDVAITKIKEFLENFKNKRKKALLLWGPSGVGKSSCIYALTENEIIELNASDDRGKSIVEEKLGNALRQQSLFSKGKVILIDDINGISGHYDRGGAQAVAKLIAKSPFPIIMTCQDPFQKKISSLKSKSDLIEFKSLTIDNIERVLEHILRKEGINFDEDSLKIIAEHSQGDLRAAINDAQMLTLGKNKLSGDLLNDMDKRLKNNTMQNVIKTILKCPSGKIESLLNSFDNVDTGFDSHMLWLDYNMPLEYYKRTDKARAYGFLSKADLFMRRIMRRQHWRFLVYVNAFLTSGIASSKQSVYLEELEYKRSTRLLKYWQANMKFSKRKNIANKIAKTIHSSTKDVIKNFEFYSIIVAKEKGEEVAENFGLDEDEILYLKSLVD